jgi:serine/threonine protein phosphatase PrpC
MGIFDGHDGSYVSEQLSRESPALLHTALASGMNQEQALRHTCAEIDRRVLSRDYRRLQAQKRHGGLSAQTFGGSTGLLVIVSKKESDKDDSDAADAALTLTVANIGDCRAVISSHGRCRHLTSDHKATAPAEKERIERAGSTVTNGRVNGVLAISRSFGDLQFKTVEPHLFKAESCCPEQWWAAAQAVTSEPEIASVHIDPSDEFLLLATDGLWDHFSGEEAVNFVRFKVSAPMCVCVYISLLL